MDDSYFADLTLDESGHLPIRPGELLYLSVQKTDTNATERAVYDIMAKWDGDCGGQDPPDISLVERLTESQGSRLASVTGGGFTSFVWNIPSGTSSALLELTGLTVDADVELVNFKIGEDPPSSSYIFFAVGALLFEINFASGNLKKPGKLSIAGSLKRLNKKGSTFSNLSGPPKLNKITAIFI